MITFKEYLTEITIKGKAAKKKDFEDLEIGDLFKISIHTNDEFYKTLEDKTFKVYTTNNIAISAFVASNSDPSAVIVNFIKAKDKWYAGTYEVKLKEIL